MPSRRRPQERLKYGYVVGESGPDQRQKLAVVTDEDLQKVAGLTRWLFPYVNHIYENGGHDGTPLPKRLSTPVDWTLYSGEVGASLLWAKSRQRMGLRRNGQTYDEYRRQMEQGFDFEIDHKISDVGGEEKLGLTFDADGTIIAGAYLFFNHNRDIERPAPNAKFTSLKEAHEATVTGRAFTVLNLFRDLVINPKSGLEMREVWNESLGVVPPPELIPIPREV